MCEWSSLVSLHPGCIKNRFKSRLSDVIMPTRPGVVYLFQLLHRRHLNVFFADVWIFTSESNFSKCLKSWHQCMLYSGNIISVVLHARNLTFVQHGCPKPCNGTLQNIGNGRSFASTSHVCFIYNILKYFTCAMFSMPQKIKIIVLSDIAALCCNNVISLSTATH